MIIQPNGILIGLGLLARAWAASLLFAPLLGEGPAVAAAPGGDATTSSTPNAPQARPNRERPPAECVDSGPHHRTWRTMGSGKEAQFERAAVQGGYVELATGLNRWDEKTASWQPASAVFERGPQGHFLARQTQHQVILAPDLNVEEAVDLLTPDGFRLRSSILGLALIDGSTGKSVLLADTKSSEPGQAAVNEIVYPDAFDGVLADVRYVINRDRFEQDVILREQIPPELLMEAGMDPSQTRLLVMTEFFQPPSPGKRVRHLLLPEGQRLTDQELSFGVMAIGAGQAFRSESEAGGIPVTKSWELLEGRQFLIESVHYPALRTMLQTLPLPAQARVGELKARFQRTAALGLRPGRIGAPVVALVPPARRPAAGSRQANRVLPSARSPRQPRLTSTQSPAAEAPSPPTDGVVIDYPLSIVGSGSDFVFKGDTTYFVSGPFNLSGSTTFEGGSVIKFAITGLPGIVCYGPIACLTGPFRPTVLTSMNDDTVGDLIVGSTGNPRNAYHANPALQIMASGQSLHDLRIAHAGTGIFFHDNSAGSNTLSHAQFVRCSTALGLNGYGPRFQNLKLQNVLIHDVGIAFAGYSFATTAEHLTLCQCGQLGFDRCGSVYGTTSSASLVNSLLVALNATGNIRLLQGYCQSATSSNVMFQTVGAAGFYLARESCRNAGTTNIDATLAGDLKRKTTFPPAVRTGVLDASVALTQRIPRDLDTPDLGFHYDPIDFAVSSLVVGSNRTLSVTPGTVIATFGSSGIRLDDYGRLTMAGEALRPARLLRYHTVQEQSVDWGATTGAVSAIVGPDHSPANASAAPAAQCRLVEFGSMAGPGYHLFSDDGVGLFRAITLQDCRLASGRLQLAGSATTSLTLNNNLLERVGVLAAKRPQLAAFNNLFWGGNSRWERAAGAAGWELRDNAFHDHDLNDVTGGASHSHNAYLGTAQRQFGGATSNNLALASFAYSNGPLGRFYQSSTNLVDRGSRSAGSAGLFHFTVRTNQLKETSSVVDIGFHSVACVEIQGSPQPQDSDGDSVADYLEDRDGNGAVNTSETDWRDAADIGLRVRITRPVLSEPVP